MLYSKENQMTKKILCLRNCLFINKICLKLILLLLNHQEAERLATERVTLHGAGIR